MTKRHQLHKIWLVTACVIGIQNPAYANGLGRDAAIPAPPDRSADVLNPFSASLDVSEEDSELTLSVSTKPTFKRAIYGESQRVIRRSFGVDFSLPLGGKDDLTNKATLDGLSNGAAIKGKFVLFGASATDNMDAPAFLNMHRIAKQKCLDEAGADEEKKKVCKQDPLTDFTVEWSGFSEASVNRAVLSPAWSLVLEATVGWNDFKSIEAITLRDLSKNKMQYAFGGTYTYFPKDALTTLSFGAEYERSYKAVDDTVVCKPVVVNPSDDCKKGAAAAPKLDRSLILKAEARRLFPLGPGRGELGIAPIASFDALDNEYGLELPLYWIPAGDSPILPGIKVGYSSDDRDVTFGAFLKTSF